MAVISVLSVAFAVTSPLASRTTVVSGFVQSQEPGIYLPAVFFRINYTGVGDGGYTYVVSWNTTDHTVETQSTGVLVAHSSPFTYTLFLQWPHAGVLFVQIAVRCSAQTCADGFAYGKTFYFHNGYGSSTP